MRAAQAPECYCATTAHASDALVTGAAEGEAVVLSAEENLRPSVRFDAHRHC